MQETYVYCDIHYVTLLTVCCMVKSLKHAAGTLIQYLLDRNTFIIRIQCCVLEML